MTGASNFFANGVALIAQVGSENQAQPARVLASSVLRFNSVCGFMAGLDDMQVNFSAPALDRRG
jgi:hypothetical protein